MALRTTPSMAVLTATSCCPAWSPILATVFGGTAERAEVGWQWWFRSLRFQASGTRSRKDLRS